MDIGNDRIISILTGELPFIVFTALLITIPISWVLLKLYRRAVIHTMAEQSGKTGPQPLLKPPTPFLQPENELSIRVLDPDRMPQPSSLSPYQKILLNAPTKAVLVYLLAGLGYAIVMTWGILISDGMSFKPIRVSIMIMLFVWPVALAAQYLAGTTIQRWLKPIFIYWGIYIVLVLLAVVNNPQSSFLELIALWVLTNLSTTLVWWIVLNRRLRAVSPMVLIFLLLAVTGSLFMLELLFYNEFILGLTILIFEPLGVGLTGFIIINVLFGFILFCVIGWLILRWIRWQYEHQKLSDQIITLDTLWILFMLIDGASIVLQGLVWILLPLSAFLAYKIITIIGFRWLIRQNEIPNAPCLLLLRVFSLGKRSEQLFDAVSTHWRYLGKIQLIAGPDLATTTIEPHEFLDYVSRNLGHNFMDSKEKFETAIKSSHNHLDRDSRYRVEEFFCYGDTWKMVLTGLANTCESVLMDLRGFSPQNSGCIFEINTLIHQLPLDRVIFTTDDTTDHTFLKSTIESAWKNLPNDSPNRESPNPKLTLFEYRNNDNVVQDRLLDSLCKAAFPKT